MNSRLGSRGVLGAPKFGCRAIALLTVACCAWLVAFDAPARSAVPVGSITDCTTAVAALNAGLNTISRSRLALRAADASGNKAAIKRAKKRLADARAQGDLVRAKIKALCGAGSLSAQAGGCGAAIDTLAAAIDKLAVTRAQLAALPASVKAVKRRKLKAAVQKLVTSVDSRSEAMREACNPPKPVEAMPVPAGPTGPAPDTTAPTVTVTAQSPTNSTTPAVTVVASEPAVTIRCSIDGGAFSVVPENFNTAPLSENSHTIACRGTDASDNTGPNAVEVVVVDLTAPAQLPIIAGPTATSSHDLAYSVYLWDAANSAVCRVDGGAYLPTVAYGSSANFDVTLSAGAHQIECHLIDAAGNAGGDAALEVTVTA